MSALTLDAKTTALVVIDLQQAIVGRTSAPHLAGDVVKRSAELAKAVREKGGTVVYVRVDLANFRAPNADAPPMRDPKSPPPPASASEVVMEAGIQEGDVRITKRFWGAFDGTELEQELRGRNVQTIVLCGISTNIGVESTARTAAGLGFSVVLVEDAMAAMNVEGHAHSVQHIFPRLGRVRSCQQIMAALG